MKNVKESLLAIIMGLPLVIGFASCDKLSNDEESLLGNWEYQSVRVEKSDPNFDTIFETDGYALYRNLQFNDDRTAKVEIMNTAQIDPPSYSAEEFNWSIDNKGTMVNLSSSKWGNVSWNVIILSYTTLKFEVTERYHNAGYEKSTYTYLHSRRSNSRPN